MIKNRHIIVLSCVSIILILMGSYAIYYSQKMQNSFFRYEIGNTIDKGLLTADFNIKDKLKTRIEDIKEIAIINEEALHENLSAIKYLGLLLICIGGAIADVSYSLYKDRKSQTSKITT